MFITCSKAEKIGEEPPDHIYPKHYEGYSKTKETDAALHFYKTMCYNSNGQLTLAVIVADDDSIMRALLRHVSFENKKGRFPTKNTRTRVACRSFSSDKGCCQAYF